MVYKMKSPLELGTVQFWVRDPTNKKPIRIIRVAAQEAAETRKILERKGFVIF